MKLFTTKNIVQKIMIILVLLLLFNFIYPNYAHAASFGGVLWDPVQSLVVGLGDAIVSIMQNLLLGIDLSRVTISKPRWMVLNSTGMVSGNCNSSRISCITIYSCSWSVLNSRNFSSNRCRCRCWNNSKTFEYARHTGFTNLRINPRFHLFE